VTDKGRYHGGMVFFGRDHASLHRFCDRIAETLEDYGHPVEQHGMTADDRAGITASHYHITLTTSPYRAAPDQGLRSRRVDAMGKLNLDHPQPAALPTRLVIDIRAADSARDDKDISELLLVVMLYRLVEMCDACAVEWLSPETVLTLDQLCRNRKWQRLWQIAPPFRGAQWPGAARTERNSPAAPQSGPWCGAPRNWPWREPFAHRRKPPNGPLPVGRTNRPATFAALPHGA